MRFYRALQVIVATSVAVILTCLAWLATFSYEDSTKSVGVTNDQSKGNTAENTVAVVQWQPGYLEAIDNRRIIMHETSGRGCLNARQSCAAESAAKHNPDRPVQLLMRHSSMGNQSLSNTWLSVLRHYSNVQIIQLSDESQYFNNTALYGRYQAGKWRPGPEDGILLSDYLRSISLFRGGGLLIDLDNGVTIKPLTWRKWNNFFVVKRDVNDWRINVKMLHLLHGHHLIDEIILHMAKDDLEMDGRTMTAAIEASLNRVCGINELGRPFENRCLDVRLVDEDDVFLPPLISPHRRSIRLGITTANEKEMVKNAVPDHPAVFVTWGSMGKVRRNFEGSIYSSLLAKHCPFTVRQIQEFPHV